MGVFSRYLCIPRPRVSYPVVPNPRSLRSVGCLANKSQRFLYFMSLRTGVEMIALSMVFNKLTGFYGLLAILTGRSLSPLQLSMYLYSVGALVLLAFLMPHIRKQSPFQCLALAWFYAADTIINTAFTSAFALTWFLAVSADNANQHIPSGAPGSGTIDDTAGFTNPKHNVSEVDVVVSPGKGISGGQEAVAYGVAGSVAATASNTSVGHGVEIGESLESIIVVVLLTLVRVYFILVVCAFARQVLRQHIYTSSSMKLHIHTDGTQETRADNPFAIGTAEGEGWRGKFGRAMVMIGGSYWLGGQADEDWMKGLDGRFKNAKLPSGPPGTLERERRARSGTGPSKPPASVTNAAKV